MAIRVDSRASHVHPEAKELEELFLKTRPRTDVGKKVMEDLGFGEMFWNAKLNATQIHLTCGSYSPFASSNVCVTLSTRERPGA